MLEFRDVVIFSAGVAVGGLAASYILEEKHEALIQEELESIREAFDVEREEETKESYLQPDKPVEFDAEGYLDGYDTTDVDYNNFTKPPIEDVMKEKGLNPVFPEEEPDDITEGYLEDDEGDLIEEDIIMEEQDYPGPRVIPFDQAGEHLHYDEIELTYYAGDDTLADERDEIIEDPEYILGEGAIEALMHSGESSIIVQNDDVSTYFEVLRSDEDYTVAVLNIQPGE